MKVYAVKHKDETIRANSRSGGIFTALSDLMFDIEGIIYGCVFDEALRAVHVRAENKEIRDKMRGSKYVQSSLGDTFIKVKKDLEDGKNVLFSGTSCQAAGLKGFLGKDYENLLCIDIVCHGVSSPLVWKKYLEWQGNVSSVDFRNKSKYGWRDYVETLIIDNKMVDSRIWTTIFYGHNVLRPACYECPYKSIHHPGDITIADYWGIEKAAPEFDDNKGVSLVLLNTGKGVAWFERVKDVITWKETKIENSMQPPLIAPLPKPGNRGQFWKDFRKRDFAYIAKVYGGNLPIWEKAIRKIYRTFKKIISSL